MGFIDQLNGTHTNTIESTWRTARAFLSPYFRKGYYIYHLARYMFAARCRAEGVNNFTMFIHLATSTDWTVSSPSNQKLAPRNL
jgi:hypothetical protein